MQISHYVISTTLAVGLLAASALPAAAAQLPNDAASSPIVSAIENQLDANASLPAAYAVVDGSEVTAGGREGADLDTPFVIGSVSKTFTALAVLAVACTLALTACGSNTDSNDTASSGATGGDAPKGKVGVILPDADLDQAIDIFERALTAVA
mgnify:CR=1 FL=1